MSSETTGQRIRRLRLAAGKSQRAIARTGSSYAFISRIERDQRNPSMKALIEIADQLDTTALYLLTGSYDGPCPCCRRHDSNVPHDESE
jgi:transcriptional regulator with XRE-family HTH domain